MIRTAFHITEDDDISRVIDWLEENTYGEVHCEESDTGGFYLTIFSKRLEFNFKKDLCEK